MRKRVKYLICIMAFLLLFLPFLGKISDVLRRKARKGDVISAMYQEPAGSLDVIYVGSSMCYSNISPMDIWNRQGITGHNLATGSQPLSGSYYLIKEAIRLHQPKVIVLETYSSTYRGVASGALHNAVDSIPLGMTRLEMWRDLAGKVCDTFSDRVELLFPFFKYHSRWNYLKESDFYNDYGFLKGALINFSVEEVEEPPITAQEEDIFPLYQESIYRIIELCKKANVNLVFLRVPSANYDKVLHMQGTSNQMLRIGSEQGIWTLDLLGKQEELGISYEDGFRDRHHGNARTQLAISEYLADWLKENFGLEDHREDPAYQAWWDDYIRYQEYRKECEISGAGEDDNEE